ASEGAEASQGTESAETSAPAEDDPFAAGSGGEVAGASDAPAEAPSQDLFGSSSAAADPFGGSAAASPFGETSDDVVSSPAPAAAATSPKVSEGQASLTGARNENSVLFSLSNLQAL